MTSIHAVVTAAGTSRRMGGIDKLLLPLDGKPLLIKTLEPFLNFNELGTLVVAVNPERVQEFRDLFEESFGPKPELFVTAGGAHRQESILFALRKLQELSPEAGSPVLIHDGARPFVTAQLFEELLSALEDFEGVIPAAPVRDTVKRVEGKTVLHTEDRDTLRLVQTPQAFRFQTLLQAHERAASEGFLGTDDASLLEREDKSVGWIPGPVYNLKVTVPEDLTVVEHLYHQMTAEHSLG